MSAVPVPVIHVITQLELGGAQQTTLETMARLDRSRFAPQLVCGPGGMLDEEARALADVPVERLDRISMYVPPAVGLAMIEEIKAIGCVEFWLNPGSESDELIDAAREAGLEPIIACSIVDLK